MKKFKFVDLFAGCGGFSLGLTEAGFEHVLAVERSPMAAQTYYHNIVAKKVNSPVPWADYIELDKNAMVEAGLYIGDIEKIHSDQPLLGDLRRREIDLVAGGPPCQGFSTVGKRNPDDIRNSYPYKFFEIVEAILPKAFVMENVIGISLNFRKYKKDTPLDTVCGFFQEHYSITRTCLNAYHYGVPQGRQRIVVIGIRKDLADKLCLKHVDSKHEAQIWRSDFLNKLDRDAIPTLAPIPIHSEQAVRLKRALIDIDDHGYTKKRSSYSQLMKGNQTVILNHERRRHGDETTFRFKFLHEIRKIASVNIANSISTPESISSVVSILRKTGKPIVMPDGTYIPSKPSLERAINRIATKKHSQILLDGDKASRTMMTIPDDYIHYKFPRVLTVREMARIQSFPDNFEFMGKVTTGGKQRKNEVPQYSQVGNAVPPLLAKAIGTRLSELLQAAESNKGRP
ncbi:DNA cytosine methyltransferase [Geomonas agri]|uniref:DNA cytosine methyltransferase n=1 Tax=Geomonas agri TaxID=2873702 RepID=UPI001CD6B302|nr:DNA cytosine methyltransferase [Geomonas agri]